MAFAPIARDIAIDPTSCAQRVDLDDDAGVPRRAGRSGSGTRGVAPAACGKGRRRAGTGGGRSRPAAVPESRARRRPIRRAGRSGDLRQGRPEALLPPGFSIEASADSVTAFGNTQATAGFFGPNGPGDFAERFGFGNGFGDAASSDAGGPGARGGPAAGGGPGGFGGRAFGPGGPGGPFGRGGRGNQIRGSVFQSFDTSALDTAPYPLNGAASKPDYLQQRFGATLGGPLVIGKLVNSPRTFFFLNYTGNHSRNPFDAFSTVPSLAERGGDLSAFGGVLLDPITHQPFANNQIPAARIDPAARSLLDLIPRRTSLAIDRTFTP